VLDFGWAELLVIMAVAVFVIGPQDIPKVMHGIGRFLRRLQYIKFAISKQFDDVMNTADIEELRKSVNFEQGRDAQDSEMESELDSRHSEHHEVMEESQKISSSDEVSRSK